ncbi:MAG TPA: SRPBCC family protein [Candidatus Eisenbacteria bacterium]
MKTTTTDRIEKEVLLRAPRSRVWRALTDSKEFGSWFQALFTEPFRLGARTKGRITYPGYEHLVLEFAIEKIEPERLFSFRWHPNALDPNVDYSKEPMTLVEFTLEDAEGGTRLRLVESGFDAIPIERRAAALKSNDGGWTQQMVAIEGYLRKNP